MKKRSLSELRRQVMSLQGSIAYRDKIIKGYQEGFDTKDGQIKHLQEKMEEQKKIIPELKNKIARKVNKIDILINRLDFVRSEKNYYKNKYKSSFCYKIKKMLGLKR